MTTFRYLALAYCAASVVAMAGTEGLETARGGTNQQSALSREQPVVATLSDPGSTGQISTGGAPESMGTFNPVNPHLGGSPFPSGQEPSLTHVAKVFWTTVGGVITCVDVTAKGGRPIRWQAFGTGGIGPDCDLHFRVSATKQERDQSVRDFQAGGEGTAVFRVFGFKLEDYTNAPAVRLRYFRDGKLIGETGVEVQPISDKIKANQPKL